MCKLLNEKSFLFAALLLSAVSMSCSKDPDETDKPNKPDDHNIIEWGDSTLSGDATMGSAMTFKVGGGMSVERTAQTRVTTNINGTATFSTGDLVAVAVTRSGGSEVIKLYQVKSDGSLEYAGGDNDPFVWKSTGETVSLRAWSYGTSTNLSYTLTAPETRDYTLETDQQTNGYRELLYCKAADKSYSSGAISLNFYHQLARVVLNISNDFGSSLSSVCFGNGSSVIPQTATFALTSTDYGGWTDGGESAQITPKTETANTCYSAVLIPTTYTTGTKFVCITIGNRKFAYQLDADLPLVAGNQYIYSITVSKTGLSVTSATVSAWGNGDEANSTPITATI